MRRKLLGIINVDFDATGQPLIIYSAFVKYLRKKWEYSEAVHQLLLLSGGWSKSKYREQFMSSCLSSEFKTALTVGQWHCLKNTD